MLMGPMKPHGTYKLAYRGRQRSFPAALPPPRKASDRLEGLLECCAREERREQRILDSLRGEIVEGGGGNNLRIRRVFATPREIYRLELSLPDLGYQRTTFLDRDALEELLEADDVREVVETACLGR